jgi:hypothetical protein
MRTVDQQTGSAAVNGELWGARARDWAEFQEGRRRLDFEECMRRTGMGQGTAVLDIGAARAGSVAWRLMPAPASPASTRRPG